MPKTQINYREAEGTYCQLCTSTLKPNTNSLNTVALVEIEVTSVASTLGLQVHMQRQKSSAETNENHNCPSTVSGSCMFTGTDCHIFEHLHSSTSTLSERTTVSRWMAACTKQQALRGCARASPSSKPRLPQLMGWVLQLQCFSPFAFGSAQIAARAKYFI